MRAEGRGQNGGVDPEQKGGESHPLLFLWLSHVRITVSSAPIRNQSDPSTPPPSPKNTHTQPVQRCTNEDTHRRERAEMFAVRTTRHDDLLRFLLANARASQRLSVGEPDGRDLNKGEEAEGKSVELWTGYSREHVGKK